MTARAARSFAVLLALAACGCGDDDDVVTPGGGGSGGGGGGGAALGAQLRCDPGELPDGDACLPPGVDSCASGFVADDGGCEPLLPQSPCSAGEIAWPGEETCRPVATCGSGLWGDVPTNSSTIFVHAGYAGGDGDGSNSKPYPDLQQAIDAAADGALLAVAAGTYGAIAVDKALTIWGVCPADVTIGGGGVSVALGVGADGVTLRALGVSGNGIGVELATGGSAVLDQLWIHDTGGVGMHVAAGDLAAISATLIETATGAALRVDGDVSVQRSLLRDVASDGNSSTGIDIETGGACTVTQSLVERVITDGAFVFDAALTVDGSVIRDIEGIAEVSTGATIYATAGSRVEVSGSVLERSRSGGVLLFDSDLDMTASVIRDVDSDRFDDVAGFGILHEHEDPGLPAPALRVERSLIERVREAGIEADGGRVTLKQLWVRDVAAAEADGFYGHGVECGASAVDASPCTLSLEGGIIERAHTVGLLALGADAQVTGLLVRDILAEPGTGAYGAGIVYTIHPAAMLTSSGTLSQSVVQNARTAGVALLGGTLDISDVLVENTAPQESTDDFGDGIVASGYTIRVPELFPPTLSLERVTVANSERAGIGAFAATISLVDSALECNPIPLDIERLDTIDGTIEDHGGNECACDGESSGCHVVSSELTPPEL